MAEADPTLTPRERELAKKLLSDPTNFPIIFKDWLQAYLESNPPMLPISQIVGFSGFTVKVAAAVAANQTTTSSNYTDLSTAGPSLSALADGKYVFLFGAAIANSTDRCYLGVKINSTEADDAEAIWSVAAASAASLMMLKTATLGNGDNTATLRYRVDGGTGNYRNRWLVAIRYDNP